MPTSPHALRAIRAVRAPLAVLVVLAIAAAARAHADPVRVAVVGFTGDLSGQELTDLAASIRGSLSRQADPKALIVVTREEMGLVYRQRGAPCRPDEVGCIVEASDAWQARLFIRGVVRRTSDGVIVGATLESVRGVLVATSQTPPSQKLDIDVAVPVLVRELLQGEKAYRARMTPAESDVHCKCLAIKATAIAGEIVADDRGLRFDVAPGAGTVSWRYPWDGIAKIEPASHGVNPAMTLLSSTNDTLTVYFNLGDDRDACLAGIARKRLAHQR